MTALISHESPYLTGDTTEGTKDSVLIHLLSADFVSVQLSAVTNHTSKYKENRHFVGKYYQYQSQNAMHIGWGESYFDKMLASLRI